MARLSLPRLERRSPRKVKATSSSDQPKRDLRSLLTVLKTLARRRWQAVAAAGLVTALALFWFGLRPAMRELTAVREAAATAERRAANLAQEYEDIQSPEGAQAAQAKFDRAEGLDVELPPQTSPVELLAVIADAASRTGVELGASSPVATPAAGPAERLEFYIFNLTVTGEFEQIIAFLEQLKDVKPLVTVWSGSFTYLPGNADAGVQPRVEFAAELRFWVSSLPTIAATRAELDAARGTSSRSDDGEDQASTEPAGTGQQPEPAAPSTTAPAPTDAATPPATDAGQESGGPSTTAPPTTDAP